MSFSPSGAVKTMSLKWGEQRTNFIVVCSGDRIDVVSLKSIVVERRQMILATIYNIKDGSKGVTDVSFQL